MHPKLEAEINEPAFRDQVSNCLTEKSVLARGLARSYGDASLNDRVVSMLKLNRIIDFDSHSGEIECEAGTSLAQIIDVVLPHGFFLPVTPGTKFITVGGAIAADVHGKNHHIDGCFSEHVLFMDVMIDDATVLRCSKDENPDLFYRTVGGMGLTGVILSARFRLKDVETAFIVQKRVRCKDLKEVIEAFNRHSHATYSVAWLDVGAKGKRLGRSVLLIGEHAKSSDLPKSIKGSLSLPKKTELSVPFNLPKFTINSLSIKAFNLLYYLKNGTRDRQLIDLDSYFYPLDSVHHWNKVYGSNGFTQYQFVIPMETSEQGLTEILNYISASNYSSFLTVLKLFGRSNPLAERSFPRPGYTLAVDFKIDNGINAFIGGLDDLVEKYGGRIYLAKDAYSRLGKQQLTAFNARQSQHFNSALMKRLRD